MRYIIKGDVKTFIIALKNCEKQPIDLSDKTIRLMIKKNKEESDSKAIYDEQVVNPETNIIYFELPSTLTQTFDVGDYYVGAKLYETVDGVVKNREFWCEELKIVNGLFRT